MQAPEGPAEGSPAPDDPAALKALFEGVVQAARQGGDGSAVVRALEPFLATRQDLDALFGPEIGARAWVGYSDKVAAALREDAGAVVPAQVRAGRTEVWVEQVGPAFPDRTTAGDQAILDAMHPKRPLYTVRLQRPGEKLGLRLNGFVFLNGRWRALLKAYDYLAEPPAPDAEPSPPDATVPADAHR